LKAYLDASVLVALFVEEAGTPAARSGIGGRQLVVGPFAASEFSATIARRVRLAELSNDQAVRLFADFDLWTKRFVEADRSPPPTPLPSQRPSGFVRRSKRGMQPPSNPVSLKVSPPMPPSPPAAAPVGLVAYQGIPGSYSHAVAQQVFPAAALQNHLTFEDVFAAVQAGQADRGVAPIDNVHNGRVTDVHHLIPRYDLSVVGEFYLPVRHQLLGVPGAQLEGVRAVLSHPQALGQCRSFLRAHGIAPVDAANTAVAAKTVAEAGDPSRAAIASPEAADLYGLVTLAADISDIEGNTTRFFIVARERQAPPPGAAAVTILTFATQSIPAALFKALGGFATNSINLTKIDSYSVGGDFSTAQFIIEVEAAPEEERMQRALAELAFFSTMVRIVGVFARAERP
jgi:prephenate dehydratase